MKSIISIILLFICQNTFSQVNSIFTISPSNGCSPLSVSFTDLSTGSPTNWNWDLGNGNTSIQQNPGAVYITPGDYIVSLTVSNGVDTSTSFDTIRVFDNPVVNFLADDSIGCSNLDVVFTNTSITGTGIASVLWNFGDGSTSTNINATHTFSTGIFDITLIVTDSSGCSTQGDKLNYINSIPPPDANFSATNAQNCFVPNTVMFTNTSIDDAGATYFWDFGDGNTSVIENPTHNYTTFGSYDVKLIVNKNGCIDSISYNSFIVLSPQNTDFTSNLTSGCVGQAIQFTDLSTITPDSYSWDFGDGTVPATSQNPSHTYNTAGTFTVTLTTNKPGCDDIETKVNYITINDNPTVSFIADQTDSCGVPFTVNFNSTTSAVTNYSWNFGDGNSSNIANPSHTYTNTGSFSVSLMVTNAAGCSASDVQNGYINIIPPNANFLIDTAFGCVPKTVQITDISTSSNGIVTWLWDFGDGTTQNGPNNPSHTYIDTGSFNISLIVVDNDGCTDTLSPGLDVSVGQNFVVDFSATPTIACKVDPITFTNLTDTLFVEGINWLWDFGDGGTLQTFDAMYEYGDTGVFEVSLTANHNGCASSLSIPDLITINPPIALFSSDVSCDNYLEVSFIDESIEPETWLWAINGDSIFSQNTSYIFPDFGTYNTTLYVENLTHGCIDSLSENITLEEPTLGFFSDDSIGCAPFSVQFTDTSNLAIGWTWDFGDGGTSNSQNPSHIFTNFGNYDISLTIENTYGCFDTIIYLQMINVIGSDANFNATDTSGCRPFLASFNDLSSSVAGPIVNWSWDFGDGNTSNIQNPTNLYTSVGTFDVSLTTTDSAGCVSTFTRINYITSTGPIPSFTNPNLVCVNSLVNFTNTSTSLGGTLTTWNWDFGDGTTSALENPTHTYTDSGTYNVSLYIEDDNGCDTTYVVNNVINIDTLIVDFSADSTVGNCTGFIVNFSESVSQNPISWSWDFGNGNTSNIANPSTVFSNVGDYDITLIAENNAGCIDTIVKTDFISVNGPTGILSVSEDTGCIDMNVDFNIISPNSVNQVWDFGDGTVINNNLFDISNTYTNANTFFPLVVLEDSAGCQIPYYFDTIYTGNLEALLAIDTDYICTPDEVSFTDLSISNPPIQSWSWDFGDGNTSNAQNPNNSYTQSGIFDISLIVDNGLCMDTITENQYIVSDSSTIASFSFVPPAILCPPINILFSDMSSADSSIINWNWDFGNGLNSNLQNPGNITFDTSGTFYFNLDVTTIKGCTSSYSDSIVIHEIPPFNFDLDTIILCNGNDTTLPAINDNADITWTPIDNLSCSDCPDPTISGITDNTYFVSAVNEFNCVYEDTLELLVSDLPTISVSEDQNVLAGSLVNLSASSTGVTGFNWSPADNLDCNNCDANIFTANESTEITVSISDDLGCENSAVIMIQVFNMCDKGFLLFPNVFTPNNDNINDVFKITRRQNLEPEINYLRIFDRWGKLVFETNDIEDSWDGTFNGKALNNGVYVYTVDVVCADGNQQILNGNVTIIR